jgi:hypothetical protein
MVIKDLSKTEINKLRVSLWIDDYSEIFSDFDPRPYSQRTVSEDFINETKRVVRGNHDKTEVSILIPYNKRDKRIESIIRKRLIEHFNNRYIDLKEENKNIINRGRFFILFGFIILMINNFIFYDFYDELIYFKFLFIVLEPVSWFSFWEGLNLTVFQSKDNSKLLNFNKKMSFSEIIFQSFDE